MKQIVRVLFLVLLAAIAVLAWTFVPQDLDVPPAPAVTASPQMTTPNVEVKAVFAGKMYSSAGFAYRGGNLFEERIFAMGGLLVQHPKGTLLFDTGFGKHIAEHFKTTPWLMQATSSFEQGKTVAEQLAAAGITLTGIYLTHCHLDHVSGLDDLPGIPVYLTEAERKFVDEGGEPVALTIGTSEYRTYDFPNGPYLGFDKSFDVFADGSVVLVPAPGHTPGSIFAFINTSDGTHYLLIGDTAWQSEGVDRPAEKPWLSRVLVDTNPDQVRALLIRLHQLKQQFPELIIVPAHDRRVWEKLPQLE